MPAAPTPEPRPPLRLPPLWVLAFPLVFGVIVGVLIMARTTTVPAEMFVHNAVDCGSVFNPRQKFMGEREDAKFLCDDAISASRSHGIIFIVAGVALTVLMLAIYGYTKRRAAHFGGRSVGPRGSS